MSFSSDIKQELNKNSNLANKEIVKYETMGYLVSKNTNLIEKNNARYSTESDYNINRFSKLLSNLNINHKIEINGKNFIITFKIKEIDFINIDKNEIYLKEEYIKEILKNENYLKAIIRGAFMGGGSVNNPKREYHLEVDFSNEYNLEKIIFILKHVNVITKKIAKDNQYFFYIKEGEQISNFLALIGASNAVLNFEDIRIHKEINGKVNRLVNCETANLNKTINASIEQIAAIRKLQKEGNFNKLDDNLKEIAQLRLDNPNISLRRFRQTFKKSTWKIRGKL